MKIALCIKQVLDASGPFSLTEETSTLESAGLVPIANPADLTALALVRQAFHRDAAHVTAISVGPKSSDQVLRESLALSADEAIRVWDNALAGNDLTGDAVARILAAIIKSLDVNLVVCGSRGLCGASGYVGPALAEYLNFSQVCSVTHLEPTSDENVLMLHRRLDRGNREVVACQLPAVLTVDAGTVPVPYASFPQLLAAERSEIQVKDLTAIGLKPHEVQPGKGYQFNHYMPPRPRTKKTPSPEASLSPTQMMQQMMGGGATKKSGNLVEGEPRKAAEEIIRFLSSNRLL